MKQNNKLIVGLLSFFLLSFLALSSCISKSNAEQPSNAAPPLMPVLTVQSMNTPTYQEFTASLQGNKDVAIRPQVNGILTAIYVDEGVYVRKGQVLFKIDSRTYAEEKNRAHANLLAAKAALQSAQININKLEPLVKNDVVSDMELKSAKAAYEMALANVAQARAAESAAAINVGFTTLTAPVDGYIGSIPYKTGSLVGLSSLEPLTVLSETKQMHVYFSMSEKDFMHFKTTVPGTTLEEKITHIPPVTLVLADNSIYPQAGKLTLVQGQFNKETGAISFRATFPNELGLLRSGNTGRIRIPDQQTSGIIIPQEATFEIQNKTFVFVLGKDNKVSTQPVVISKNVGPYYLIQTGLKPGERIVYSGFDRLSEGLVIAPKVVSMDSLIHVSPIG